ncbi:F-box/RNI/FBD-like domain protein, partial [Trifolium medium]|nr:F-box/RNI/FBD-like domain protein [Trifolium medium]
MPIKGAVATEVLSKRWLSLWKHMSSANISDAPYITEDIFEPITIQDEADLQGLNSFVTAILPKLVSMKTLRICLAFEDSNIAALAVPQVRNWIDMVINRGVELERVDVTCYLLTEEPFHLAVLPVEVIRCETLTSLDLYGIVIDNFNFPNLPLLKSLQVMYCTFSEDVLFPSLTMHNRDSHIFFTLPLKELW